ncbi:MAG: BolA family protein [Gammaproteobacteria bacterium]
MIAEQIKERLIAALQPEHVQIVDNSEAHAGHAGARSGGHFTVSIVASAFEGKSLVQRHQMVYKALGEMMHHQIHALGIEALSPHEINIDKGNHTHE